jgi:alkylation response protein AidB-like acyl-CoA dehydrogenase
MAHSHEDRHHEDLHDELRSVASDVLAKDTETAWPVLIQTGWVELEAPENLDGAGATFREVAIILEEMGRAATASAYLGSAVLAVATLNTLQANASRDDLVREVVSGAVRPAAVLTVDHGSCAARVPFVIHHTGDGPRLHGRSVFVPDAGDADRLLLLARDPAGTLVIVNAAAHTSGLAVAPQPVLDETRRLATVTADGVEVDEMWRFDGDAYAAVDRLMQRASVAVACDSLGISEAMLAATVSYVGMRHQFGRAIGSFQAVKHACADMYVQNAVARQLVSAAVQAVAAGSPDAGVAAAMAKSYACRSAVEVAGKAMQLHGGIGSTWESAALNRSLFGSPAAHRHQLAQRYVQETKEI